MSGRRTSVRLRRSWPQRMLIIFNVGCIVAALAAAGTLAYAKRTTGQIDRTTLTSMAGTEGLSSTDPRNFLIVGNDSTEGQDDDDPAKIGRDDVEGVRSDTIMIVRVDPKDDQVRILSLPRDLWVDIPGHNASRINATLQLGGPNLLVDTIQADFGIAINHYVEVNFNGFQELVGALDGVPIYFDTPVRDGHSGLNIPEAGCVTLDDNSALAYVRSRYYQRQDADGDWQSDPQSDLGRIQRQQDFIKRLLRRAIDKGGRDPRKLAQFVTIGAEALTLDKSTTPKDLIDLGDALRTFDPETLKSYSLPVADVNQAGAKVLDLQEAEAEPTLALFRGTGTTQTAGDIDPGTVDVQVINGTGAQNQATDTTEKLRVVGFQMEGLLPDTSTFRTEVRYLPGKEAQAMAVALHLDADPVLVPVEDPGPDDPSVTVVTGPDFVDVLVTARPASEIEAPPSTTTSTTTTTTTVVEDDDEVGDDDTTTSIIDEDGVTVTEPSEFVPHGAPSGIDCG